MRTESHVHIRCVLSRLTPTLNPRHNRITAHHIFNACVCIHIQYIYMRVYTSPYVNAHAYDSDTRSMATSLLSRIAISPVPARTTLACHHELNVREMSTCIASKMMLRQ